MSKRRGQHLAWMLLLLALGGIMAIPGWTVSPLDPRMSKLDQMPFKSSASMPYLDYDIHDNGYFHSVINNNGIFGNLFNYEDHGARRQAASFYHPQYSRIQHGYYAALWVGGIVEDDTLVTVAMDVEWNPWGSGYPMEFWPDVYPFGEIERRSNRPSSPYYTNTARAEMELRATYTDTFERVWFVPTNRWDQRDHRPLNLEVTQTSYSWSYKYARDFIIVDYVVRNIGRQRIDDAFLGLYYVGCVRHRGEQPYPPSDDIAGYLPAAWTENRLCGLESMQAAYIRDNDGIAQSIAWDMGRTSSAFAIAPLRMPAADCINNFNWWSDQFATDINWGPRQKGNYDHPYHRYADGGLGNPLSDPDKYHMMAYPEVDYSGHNAALDYTTEGWLPPHSSAAEIVDGHLPQVVTSFGPVTIEPRSAVAFTVVYVIGEDLHYDRMAYQELWDPLNPYPFTRQLDYSDLIKNIEWAKRTFDNPGYDTDGDGDSGRFVWDVDSTSWDSTKVFCEGDGVPDFRGASPPPAPEVRVTAGEGTITLRWNGRSTETFFDPFSSIRDFEGYRVHIARSPRQQDMTVLSSFDNENYSRWRYDRIRRRWMLEDLPMTLDTLRSLFGATFEPLAYTTVDPFKIGGNTYYFTTVDYNLFDLTDPEGIHKVYPDATLDSTLVDEEGRMLYYEYEYTVKGLLQSVPYWVSVTAFDFGHPPKDLEPLESSPLDNMVEVFAKPQGEEAHPNDQLQVYCYPNPYRFDAHYSVSGYENRMDDMWGERARAVWFANLPHRCTISIYTLDGDLVRKLEHDEPAGSGTASMEAWDLINRNTEAVVTGLYYWVVESDLGTQIGKVAILK